MKLDIISNLVLGTCSFLVLCVLLVKAEAYEQSHPRKFGQTYSLTTRAEDVESGLSPVNSVKVTTSEPKLFRRAEQWTPEEEERLVRLRNEGLSFAEMVPFFEERSYGAISNKYYRLTRDEPTTRPTGKEWTEEEKERVLRLRDEGLTWDEMVPFFEGRSYDAINTMYYRLTQDPSARQSTRTSWNRQENELLMGLMERDASNNELLENFSGRTLGAIRRQYRMLSRANSAPNQRRRKYTAEEDELLLELGERGMSWTERLQYFDNRSLDGLKSRYSKLVSQNFTAEEDKLLLKLEEEGVPWRERVIDFDKRTVNALKQRLKYLKSEAGQFGGYTSQEDDAIVKAAESGMTVEEIGELIGRSSWSVVKRMKLLYDMGRLDSAPQMAYRRWYTAADFELMREKRESGMTWRQIAIEFFPERKQENIRVAFYSYLKRKKKERGEE